MAAVDRHALTPSKDQKSKFSIGSLKRELVDHDDDDVIIIEDESKIPESKFSIPSVETEQINDDDDDDDVIIIEDESKTTELQEVQKLKREPAQDDEQNEEELQEVQKLKREPAQDDEQNREELKKLKRELADDDEQNVEELQELQKLKRELADDDEQNVEAPMPKRKRRRSRNHRDADSSCDDGIVFEVIDRVTSYETKVGFKAGEEVPAYMMKGMLFRMNPAPPMEATYSELSCEGEMIYRNKIQARVAIECLHNIRWPSGRTMGAWIIEEN